MRKSGNGGRLMLENLASAQVKKIIDVDTLTFGLREAAEGFCMPIKEDGGIMGSYFVLEMMGMLEIRNLKPGTKLKLTQYGREVYDTLKRGGVYRKR